jgi:hypothetical protein
VMSGFPICTGWTKTSTCSRPEWVFRIRPAPDPRRWRLPSRFTVRSGSATSTESCRVPDDVGHDPIVGPVVPGFFLTPCTVCTHTGDVTARFASSCSEARRIQRSAGRSVRSTTKTSAGRFCAVSARPSCSRMATRSNDGDGGECSAVHVRRTSKLPLSPV